MAKSLATSRKAAAKAASSKAVSSKKSSAKELPAKTSKKAIKETPKPTKKDKVVRKPDHEVLDDPRNFDGHSRIWANKAIPVSSMSRKTNLPSLIEDGGRFRILGMMGGLISNVKPFKETKNNPAGVSFHVSAARYGSEYDCKLFDDRELLVVDSDGKERLVTADRVNKDCRIRGAVEDAPAPARKDKPVSKKSSAKGTVKLTKKDKAVSKSEKPSKKLAKSASKAAISKAKAKSFDDDIEDADDDDSWDD